jgi:hypothetical protein
MFDKSHEEGQSFYAYLGRSNKNYGIKKIFRIRYGSRHTLIFGTQNKSTLQPEWSHLAKPILYKKVTLVLVNTTQNQF